MDHQSTSTYPIELSHSSDGTVLPAVSSVPRKLSKDEEEKLRRQTAATEFKRKKLFSETRKNWDKFYLRNKDNFFKDRWWTQHEFEELLGQHVNLQDPLNYLEVGCGVGNLLFPLQQLYPHWNFYGFDFSDNAIRLLRERCTANNVAISVAVADLTADKLSLDFSAADIATLIFVLSALSPAGQRQAVKNLANLVKNRGVVIVRDYGINDYAMVRFGRQCKLDERFYARQDGTMAYYFKIEELDDLFIPENFHKITGTYLFRKTINHQKGVSVDRVFVQAVYIKS